VLLLAEVAFDEAAGLPGRRQVARERTEGDVQLEVLGLELVGGHDQARLAGDERREQHGVLGTVVMVQDPGEELGPSLRPGHVPGVGQPFDVDGLGAQSEVNAHETENCSR
jgi:hypothetical protein